MVLMQHLHDLPQLKMGVYRQRSELSLTNAERLGVRTRRTSLLQHPIVGPELEPIHRLVRLQTIEIQRPWILALVAGEGLEARLARESTAARIGHAIALLGQGGFAGAAAAERDARNADAAELQRVLK